MSPQPGSFRPLKSHRPLSTIRVFGDSIIFGHRRGSTRAGGLVQGRGGEGGTGARSVRGCARPAHSWKSIALFPSHSDDPTIMSDPIDRQPAVMDRTRVQVSESKIRNPTACGDGISPAARGRWIQTRANSLGLFDFCTVRGPRSQVQSDSRSAPTPKLSIVVLFEFGALLDSNSTSWPAGLGPRKSRAEADPSPSTTVRRRIIVQIVMSNQDGKR
jgi:hypothetical protein